MATNLRVTVPDGDGLPLPRVFQHHLPRIAAARHALNSLYRDTTATTVEARVHEIVRLFQADDIDCGFCKNIRLSGEDGQLIDDDEWEAISRGGTEADASQDSLALDFAESFYHDPASIPSKLTNYRTAFTMPQLVELALALTRLRAGSKAQIVLGLEPEDMHTMQLTNDIEL